MAIPCFLCLAGGQEKVPDNLEEPVNIQKEKEPEIDEVKLKELVKEKKLKEALMNDKASLHKAKYYKRINEDE